MNGARLFLFFAGHAHDRQRVAVALHEAVQLQAQRLGIQPVGFHAPILLIQLLRADHVALDRERAELSLQRKTKPARFIDRMHFPGFALKFGRPVQERLFLETLRRLGISCARLLDHDVKILVHINSKLDRASAAIKLAAGFLV